jgi:hypothetical protein
MILTIFRPKRTKDGKPHVSRSYRGRYRLDEGDKLTDIPLRTMDKRVARERLEGIVREKQLEAVGVLSPHRTALQAPLEKHLSDYLADLQAVGRDDQYIFDLNNRVCRLIRECHWAFLKEVSSDSFLAWRARQTLAPKTLNEYLASARSLFNWMVKHGRIERNPLALVQKAQSNGKQLRPRRAFTREEFQRLLAVAGPRKALYLTAVFTGLRRGELAALEWDDVDLDAERPFLKSPGLDDQEPQGSSYRSSSRCRRRATVGPAKGDPRPANEYLKVSCRASKDSGSISKEPTSCTSTPGVSAPTSTHSATHWRKIWPWPELRLVLLWKSCDTATCLTTKTYTDAGLLAVWDKVVNLPSFATGCVEDSQLASQNLVRTSPSLSVLGKTTEKRTEMQHAYTQQSMHDTAGPGTTSQENVKWSGRQDLNLRPRGPKPRALPS